MPGPRPQPADHRVRVGDDAAGRSRPGRRVLRTVGWAAAGLLGPVLVAVTASTLLDALDRRRVLPPGDLVELADGRRLHLLVDGPDAGPGASGRPIVVLEAGSGGFSASMAWLRRELAAYTTVVAYDRAGYGFSDPDDRPVSAASVADDVHGALQRRGLTGPYLLVGHSLGGGYVRVFAARHPEAVAGLVLLDPVHEDQLERQPAAATEQLEQARRQLAVAPLLARLGVFRLLDVQGDIVAALPEDAGEQHRARSVTAAGMRAYGREVAVLPDLLAEVARAEAAAGDVTFGGLPALIISATEPGEGETLEARAAMDAMHRDLAGRSPIARHVTVPGADHLSLVTDANHAREVAAAVRDLLGTIADRPVARGGADEADGA
jgi:pimeloyl-ACP methyl ester carboxylesterase